MIPEILLGGGVYEVKTISIIILRICFFKKTHSHINVQGNFAETMRDIRTLRDMRIQLSPEIHKNVKQCHSLNYFWENIVNFKQNMLFVLACNDYFQMN